MHIQWHKLDPLIMFDKSPSSRLVIILLFIKFPLSRCCVWNGAFFCVKSQRLSLSIYLSFSLTLFCLSLREEERGRITSFSTFKNLFLSFHFAFLLLIAKTYFYFLFSIQTPQHQQHNSFLN